MAAVMDLPMCQRRFEFKEDQVEVYYFGVDQNPLDPESIKFLPQQQGIFDTLGVHFQQGGLCLVLRREQAVKGCAQFR